MRRGDILSGIGAVVHEQKLDIFGIVDKEGLVAGGHHVSCLLVAAISDLSNMITYQHFVHISNAIS
jgi:hypothetical protein